MTLHWTKNAIWTYYEECEFILKKWNEREVKNFVDLVDENLKRLVRNPDLGKTYEIIGVRILVISKQTSLAYTLNEEKDQLDLILFWNNLRNPSDFKKYLEF